MDKIRFNSPPFMGSGPDKAFGAVMPPICKPLPEHPGASIWIWSNTQSYSGFRVFDSQPWKGKIWFNFGKVWRLWILFSNFFNPMKSSPLMIFRRSYIWPNLWKYGLKIHFVNMEKAKILSLSSTQNPFDMMKPLPIRWWRWWIFTLLLLLQKPTTH